MSAWSDFWSWAPTTALNLLARRSTSTSRKVRCELADVKKTEGLEHSSVSGDDCWTSCAMWRSGWNCNIMQDQEQFGNASGSSMVVSRHALQQWSGCCLALSGGVMMVSSAVPFHSWKVFVLRMF